MSGLSQVWKMHKFLQTLQPIGNVPPFNDIHLNKTTVERKLLQYKIN